MSQEHTRETTSDPEDKLDLENEEKKPPQILSMDSDDGAGNEEDEERAACCGDLCGSCGFAGCFLGCSMADGCGGDCCV